MTGDAVTMRRRAFTMIELLVAIGIIAILAGLLVLGIRSLLDSGKSESTKVTLQSLQSMLAEFDAKTRLAKQPTAWRWWETNNSRTLPDSTDPNNSSLDFWRDPFHALSPSYRAAPYLDALDAPALVASISGNVDDPDNIARNGSRAVVNTQLVMNLLLTMPANRAALEKISADRYFTPSWVGGQVHSPGDDGVLYSNGDNPDPQTDVYYLRGSKVVHQGHRYICLPNNAAELASGNGAAPPAPPPGRTPWVQDNTPPAPILLDGWNNPIILVPGTGLRVRLLNGEKNYMRTPTTPETNVKTVVIISPEGKTEIDPATQNPRVVKAGRPFWASAGPDGDFAKGDDNIYSFEK
jgi:prepilin-type N-terminal cleavage/methylation domain-containing protein